MRLDPLDAVVLLALLTALIASEIGPQSFDVDCGEVVLVPGTGGSASCDEGFMMYDVLGTALRVWCVCEVPK